MVLWTGAIEHLVLGGVVSLPGGVGVSSVQILPAQLQQASVSHGHWIRVGSILVGLMGANSKGRDASAHAITEARYVEQSELPY